MPSHTIFWNSASSDCYYLTDGSWNVNRHVLFAAETLGVCHGAARRTNRTRRDTCYDDIARNVFVYAANARYVVVEINERNESKWSSSRVRQSRARVFSDIGEHTTTWYEFVWTSVDLSHGTVEPDEGGPACASESIRSFGPLPKLDTFPSCNIRNNFRYPSLLSQFVTGRTRGRKRIAMRRYDYVRSGASWKKKQYINYE